ncbi:MFS transporter [Streptomyces sp. CRN 30]|uniref:MFS transporter n=1 Tax=Streptomyces sp. CRN 30 TaxID=3075613 RepID=UPI002A7F8562|nr:MFS transporter [Streptomyces sp. CRN 30]
MSTVLRHRVYRRLLTAQVLALTGTGLATVALALLAHDLAGAGAGSVLGTALAIKMVAYVALAPFAGAVAARLPRRAVLIGADLVRAGVALVLPFVGEVWQVYVLVLVLQSASAVFTPTFQAVVVEVLPDERDYTRALSLSRLAYDLESLLSPVLAAALLAVVGHDRLFTGTALGFLASAALVDSAALPRGTAGRVRSTGAAEGIRLFVRVPALRALLALNLAVAAASAVVTVNSVVYVTGLMGRSVSDLPLALGAYGAGSMAVALALPRLLERVPDRTVMLGGAVALVVVFAGLGGVTAARAGDWRWPALLAVWAAFGAACAAVLTPVGRLVRRAAPERERAAAFAAQFSLSHACWLLTYPLAGWVGATAGLGTAVTALGLLTTVAALTAVRLWPVHGVHVHADLPPGHPHLRDARRVAAGWRHHHAPAADGSHARV